MNEEGKEETKGVFLARRARQPASTSGPRGGCVDSAVGRQYDMCRRSHRDTNSSKVRRRHRQPMRATPRKTRRKTELSTPLRNKSSFHSSRRDRGLKAPTHGPSGHYEERGGMAGGRVPLHTLYTLLLHQKYRLMISSIVMYLMDESFLGSTLIKHLPAAKIN